MTSIDQALLISFIVSAYFPVGIILTLWMVTWKGEHKLTFADNPDLVFKLVTWPLTLAVGLGLRFTAWRRYRRRDANIVVMVPGGWAVQFPATGDWLSRNMTFAPAEYRAVMRPRLIASLAAWHWANVRRRLRRQQEREA